MTETVVVEPANGAIVPEPATRANSLSGVVALMPYSEINVPIPEICNIKADNGSVVVAQNDLQRMDIFVNVSE